MVTRRLSASDTQFSGRVYAVLLDEARSVASESMRRLQQLSQRYPALFPDYLLSQVEQNFADPSKDRRGTVRLPDGQDQVVVRTCPPPGITQEVHLLDYSPGGVLVRLANPLDVGVMVGIGLAEAGRLIWHLADVRHCRREEDGWVVGCEFVCEEPPVTGR